MGWRQLVGCHCQAAQAFAFGSFPSCGHAQGLHGAPNHSTIEYVSAEMCQVEWRGLGCHENAAGSEGNHISCSYVELSGWIGLGFFATDPHLSCAQRYLIELWCNPLVCAQPAACVGQVGGTWRQLGSVGMRVRGAQVRHCFRDCLGVSRTITRS